MSAIDDVLEHNRRVVAGLVPAAIERDPARRLAIVTCMDARIDLPRALGIAPGDAHVLRNAGGLVTDDVLRSLALSQHLLGTREVMLIHHTNCGMERLDADLPAELLRGAFADVAEAARGAVAAVRAYEHLPHRDEVRGFVYDVDSHRVEEV
ncbi:MAG TPA: carbonic anhydrase [Gaiellaceae bacterium]